MFSEMTTEHKAVAILAILIVLYLIQITLDNESEYETVELPSKIIEQTLHVSNVERSYPGRGGGEVYYSVWLVWPSDTFKRDKVYIDKPMYDYLINRKDEDVKFRLKVTKEDGNITEILAILN